MLTPFCASKLSVEAFCNVLVVLLNIELLYATFKCFVFWRLNLAQLCTAQLLCKIYCYLFYCEIVLVGNSPQTKSHKSRFAALAETINSWEDEVTPPLAKSVRYFGNFLNTSQV